MRKRNLVYVEEIEERLHKWAEDTILSLEKEHDNKNVLFLEDGAACIEKILRVIVM